MGEGCRWLWLQFSGCICLRTALKGSFTLPDDDFLTSFLSSLNPRSCGLCVGDGRGPLVGEVSTLPSPLLEPALSRPFEPLWRLDRDRDVGGMPLGSSPSPLLSAVVVLTVLSVEMVRSSLPSLPSLICESDRRTDDRAASVSMEADACECHSAVLLFHHPAGASSRSIHKHSLRVRYHTCTYLLSRWMVPTLSLRSHTHLIHGGKRA